MAVTITEEESDHNLFERVPNTKTIVSMHISHSLSDAAKDNQHINSKSEF